MKHTRPSPDNRIVTDGDSGGHIHIGSNPDTVAHRYGLVRKLEVWIFIIMTRSTQKALLRNYRMIPDSYWSNGIEPGIIADGRMIADLDAPGIMQPRPGTHPCLLA